MQTDSVDETQPLQGQMAIGFASSIPFRAGFDKIRDTQRDGVPGEYSDTNLPITVEPIRFSGREGFQLNEEIFSVK